MTTPDAKFQHEFPDLVIEQGDVRLCHARALIIPHRNFEGAGYKFQPDYELSNTVVQVTDSVGHRIGTAYLERDLDGLWASVVFDYATPERLDAQHRQTYALGKGTLHLPAQTMPVSLETVDGAPKYPMLQIDKVSIEAVVLTSRSNGAPLVVVDSEESS